MSIILILAPLFVFVIGTVIVLLLYKTFSSRRIRGVARQAIGNTYIAIPILSFLFLVFVLLPMMLPGVWSWYIENSSLFIGTILGLIISILLFWRKNALCVTLAILILIVVGVSTHSKMTETRVYKNWFNSNATEEKKENSPIVLKWRKSGSITALPDRWTIIPGKPGYNFESDDNPYKVRVKYRWRGKWKEYKGGSPNMTAFAYKSKTGKPEMFEFRFTKN